MAQNRPAQWMRHSVMHSTTKTHPHSLLGHAIDLSTRCTRIIYCVPHNKSRKASTKGVQWRQRPGLLGRGGDEPRPRVRLGSVGESERKFGPRVGSGIWGKVARSQQTNKRITHSVRYVRYVSFSFSFSSSPFPSLHFPADAILLLDLLVVVASIFIVGGVRGG